VSGASRRAESAAAHGARWMAVATVVVGFSNYCYAVLLTHQLTVASYSRFAAGQGLILWASTVATVSVPWVLAQALVRARSDAERHSAVRFAKLVGAGGGLVTGIVVAGIATRFAGPSTALAVAFSIFVIFLATTTTGWLQGRERLRTLSALAVVDNVLKNATGVVLVVVARQGDAGALAAFGIGALAVLLCWPKTSRHDGGSWRGALVNRDLWRRAVAIAGAQGMVSLFIAADVVLVALLPGNRALAASYQASAAISRIPAYVAAAVATAFFPFLSRRAIGGLIAARAVRMYVTMALPVAVVLATIPAPILAMMLPSQYGTVAALLKYTAVSGLSVGGIMLVTAFFQAADDYSVLWWLGAGLLGYVVALLAGWRADGIIGLAAGGALGTVTSLVLVGYRLVRRQGPGVFALVSLTEPAVVAVLLIMLRPYPWAWLAVASLAAMRAAKRFVRPGARHVRGPRWVEAGRRIAGQDPATSLLIQAVWRGTPQRASDAELERALELARRNRVEGSLAGAYPMQLANVLAETRAAAKLFTVQVGQVASSFLDAGIQAVLIPPGAPGDHTGASIEMVVPERDWRRALTVLADWYEHRATSLQGDSTTAVLYALAGPELRLHTSVSWFRVPAFPTERLLDRARRNSVGLTVPAPADYLRIWLARAVFQDLVLDLSSLLTVCGLLRPAVVMNARAEARREGWHAEFGDALAVARDAIDRLDRGLPVDLPVPLPVSVLRGPGAAVPFRPEAEEQEKTAVSLAVAGSRDQHGNPGEAR
jgi:O-antigen/teichoic acid export membrane protein